jgi:catechol 2,3-dioxygenase-like lactoylglutathione lyase family enzyme
MQIQRLTFIALNVSSLSESLHFYRDVLGAPIMESSHDEEKQDLWYGGKHASYSWTDGAYLHFAIYPALDPHRPITTATQIGFHVSEFEAVHQRLVESSIPVVQSPREEPWGLTARYLDPDRNIVSITQAAAQDESSD